MSMEPRYNLATKVMSNGVEVIVAGDRSTRPGEPEYLRLLSSTVTRPITLAPHTLSHHMSMLLPAHLQSESAVLGSLQPDDEFEKSTLYTTYIYPTKVQRDKKPSTVTTSTVVTNVREFNKHAIAPAPSETVTLTTSPVLHSHLHHYTFTYLNTIMDGDQPLVATSQHTVVNTVISPSDFLEPSETAPNTNTYYATKQFVATVTDGLDSQVMSTNEVITQVVVTAPPVIETLDPGVIDVTKTYFVTYTYFSTYVENDESKISTHVSVSTDIAVEKFTVKDKSTASIVPTASASLEISVAHENEPRPEKLTAEQADESENSIEPSETEYKEDSDQMPSETGDIIDEWYEKFKVKPTADIELTKTLAKTKTTLKPNRKSKTRVENADATSSYSTTIMASSTVTPQGATLLPGDQVIVLQLNNGQTSMIPVSDPAKKKTKNDTEPVKGSDILSLGTLGINSMNVLGPVFNAMADMLKSHQKEALKKRDDNVPPKKTTNGNPLLNFVSSLTGSARNPQTTTPRGPLYIPVGGHFDDADPSESEGRISILPTPEKWVQEKWPPGPVKTLDKNRRTHDNSPMPHLEGGIPISPGQVINTNSDVIIGRPSESGPRPPVFAIKDNAPIDMKPPPVEETHILLEPIGQFSTNQGVESDPRPVENLVIKPPSKPSKPSHGPPLKPGRPPPPHHGPPKQHHHHPVQSGKNHHKSPTLNIHDSGTYDLNPPPPPPPTVVQHRPLDVLPIPVHLSPNDVIENYVNPVHQHDNIPLPTEIIHTPNIPLEVSRVINQHGQPLLVNLQPSQVAQVVIPHGSSSAVIISPEQAHSTKGEVIDDPKPHPEPETVGFIGAEPVLKLDQNEISHRPINSMADIMKAETVTGEISHAHEIHLTVHPPNKVWENKPRPDYDNIGMVPPTRPSIPLHHPPPQFQERPAFPQHPQHDVSQQHHLVRPEQHHHHEARPEQHQHHEVRPEQHHHHDVRPEQHQHHEVRPDQHYYKVPNPPHQQNQPPFSHSKKDPNGIYVDISPPGHLPPPHNAQRPNVAVPQQSPVSDNTANHQSGVVHDVPLVAQVQLGSGKPEKPHLNEILINFDGEPQSVAQVKQDTIVQRPKNDYADDLAPPPPPPSSRPVQQPGNVQNFPKPHGNNKPLMPEPADFMRPPPRPDQSILVPVGVVTKPNSGSRPGEIMIGQPSDYTGEDDMDAEGDEPFKTEDGEEIQESNARPLLPGQLPMEVEKLHHNHQSGHKPSTIGVGQSLSFGSSHDKLDDSNAPGIREPETIIGSQMPVPHEVSGFNKENEAVVSIGSKPASEESAEVDMSKMDSLFGVKLQTSLPNPPKNSSRGQEGKPAKTDEVVGMAPPPVDRPRRPIRPQRPSSPFKFEMPTQTLPIPIPSMNMDNDFPPVRTPDSNKRPFKPEDIFPPRLPDNFVYREYEINTRRPPRPFVTSLPIDTPTSSTTESSNEVNGTFSNIQESFNLVTITPTEKPSPIVHERPPIVSMQKPTIRPPKKPVQEVNPQPPSRPDFIRPPPVREEPPRIPSDPKRQPPPFRFERPTGEGSFGDKMRPNKIQPPRVPSGFEKPQQPKRPQEPPKNEMLEPPPKPVQVRPAPPHRPPWQQPSGFENQPPPRPSPRPQDVPKPTYDRPPPSPVPSEFETPPPKSPVIYEQPSRPNLPPNKFEPPPNRVEPSPHFEGQPAQGQNSRPSGVRQPTLPPPALHHHNKESDQQSQPSSPGVNIQKEPAIDQEPARNEPTKYKERPNGQQDDEGRFQNLPVKGTTLKPSSVKPPMIPIPSKEAIRPSRPIETVSSTANIATLITSGSTTIFGDLYTDPLVIQPTRIVSSNQGIHFNMDGFPYSSRPQSVMVVHTPNPNPIVHTTTLTVTSTMTTVLHSAGHGLVTKTVLLTTTLISTLVDKVTETETLVKPTTSTVTQTHTISTTKTALVVPTAMYPPRPNKYPAAKPEIFIADPHDKNHMDIVTAGPHENIVKPEIFVADPRDKDIMTLTVSSSMSKKPKPKPNDQLENDSILVVVTDKPGSNKNSGDIVLGAGILSPPLDFPHPGSSTECLPECRATRNELCVKQEGIMKCVCRPGFARMFPDQPCKPTYTYSMQLLLDRMGPDPVTFQQSLQVPGSPKFQRMAEAAKEGLNRLVMQGDLRDIYHGVAISGFQPKDKKTMVDFFVQLSENIEEGKVLGTFKKTLRNSNFSLGGTEMFAARESENVHIEDFNECLNPKFHDCSEHARCFNLKGTYTCSCKEGFTDISENSLYPGRMCSDMIGCEYCGYHGTCYTRGEQTTCECFQWYSGDRCRVNLKVLLIALVTIGAILLALLILCIVMACLKRRSSRSSKTNGSSGYLRYRGPPQSLDKRAMIVDTSSESSVENLPYVAAPPPPPLPQPVMVPARKPALRQSKRPAPRQPPPDQRDRSLTVMIPRVKYRTMPQPAPVSPHLTMSTFSPDLHLNRTAAQIATEQKLISYLSATTPREGAGQQSQRPSREEKRIYEAKPAANTKKDSRVFEYEYKSSNMHITDGTSSGERRSKDDRFRRYSDQPPLHHDNSLQHRKYSAGALVSAGYAVSATGGLIHDVEESIASNTLKSTRSQFTTLNRSGDHKTMSEARSYDETLIQPQTRPLRTTYSGSTSSRLHHDETHTMVERDLGSTFLLPESHLFKPAGDRGSDISNFDSL